MGLTEPKENKTSTAANLGPGFDTLGLALSLYLTLQVQVAQAIPDVVNVNSHHDEIIDVSQSPALCEPFNQSVKLQYAESGFSADLPLEPSRNLITKTAWYVLRCHGLLAFPRHITVTVTNAIPLGRGLGSSAAAVVAGVLLANEVANLNLPKSRMLDLSLAIERHPDNVSAALLGGFVASYLHEDQTTDHTRALEGQFTPVDRDNRQTDAFAPLAMAPRMPPAPLSHYVQLPWAPEIKAVAIIPQFQLATVKARAVLPKNYTRADVVFNLQRLAVLTHALGQSPPDAQLIYPAMADRVHQPHRAGLVPGLTTVLETLTPETVPGLLGACLSGAGPTILVLATHNFDTIITQAREILAKHEVATDATVLEVASKGAESQLLKS
ncbi:Trihydroxynaphthalene reductase [Dimargaris verticillata]|uniref:Homoserine kinase n=1 Tax=Dimargaris verticillata TaxID=2761393 RepID=A0A9W8B159_9FUNG|nr:Trihydroxynaphthalene reductase [Dimargaris verticillata]